MDNYQLSRDRAQAYFLNFDQQQIIDAWHLSSDDQWLYVTFFSAAYRVCRKTGTVERCCDNSSAGFEEVLSIFDLLCHEGSGKYLSGRFAPVNSLKGRPRAIGVGTDFHTASAAVFEGDIDGFHRVCRDLGGEQVSIGDIGYRFPVFGDLSVILKFYHSDEDFPASVTLLWDENTLLYIYYETVFYIAGFLLRQIARKMNEQHGG